MGIYWRSTIRQINTSTASLRSTNATLAIMLCVLHLKASRRALTPCPPAEPPVLALWLNQGTLRFCGETPQTLRSRCSLDVKLLLTWPPRRPGSVLVLWSKPTKPHVQTLFVSRYPASAHVHDFILLFLLPWDPHLIPFGHRVHQANPTCLSTPQRPRKVETFRVCSSPALRQIKPQPAPAIFDQESVHTTLSITHHTKERPSTGPRTLRSSLVRSELPTSSIHRSSIPLLWRFLLPCAEALLFVVKPWNSSLYYDDLLSSVLQICPYASSDVVCRDLCLCSNLNSLMF
jgi:hypothetical protein